MDLFEKTQAPASLDGSPLAARMAPGDWQEFVGQAHLLGPGCVLRRAIEADRLESCLFYGPPGTGKTALARLAARKSRASIEYVNAVTAGVQELRQVVKRALERKRINAQRTLLIVDEIHHFNRTQQDALLPDVERGNLILVGLTTENPYFYVNAALLSRSSAYEFFPLSEEDLNQLLERALKDSQRGLGSKNPRILQDAKVHLIRRAEGDARRLLNMLDVAVLTTPAHPDGRIEITLAVAESCAQKRALRYDKTGDDHYDTISAFIKSMRGSDVDAALYWMAKMLMAGEDPRFIARRIMIFAAEDVGNADPQALSLAAAAARVVEMVGMPEARIPLAQALTYVSTAPKSNASYLALLEAEKEVQSGPRREIPNHLKDKSRDGKERGHGQGYLYPHEHPHHHVEQMYMPARPDFYRPSEEGFETVINDRLAQWRKKNPSRST